MRRGIRLALSIWLGLVILPIVLAGVFAIQVIDARLSDRITADLANAQRLEVARIEDALRIYQRDARVLASGKHVIDFVEKIELHLSGELAESTLIGGYDGFSPIDPNASLPLQQLAMDLQKKASSVGSEVVELHIVDTQGQILGATGGFSWIPYDDELITRALSSASSLFGNAFRTAAGEDQLGLVEPIFNDRAQVIGALVLEMRLGTIVDLVVEHEGFGDTSESHIAQPDRNGNAEFITLMRFRRNAAFNLVVPKTKNLPINWSLESPIAQVVRSPDYRNEDSILAIKTIAATGWGLVVKIDAAEAFAPVAEIRRVIAVACFAAVIVVMLGWGLYLHPLAKRLQKAALAANKLSKGDYNSLIADTSKDEIGDMARSIDRLATDLQHDIHLRASAERQLLHQATHDELTGLHNRKFANDFILEYGEKCRTTAVTVFFLDLDGFKSINDTQGHAIGDEVLVVVASRLCACVSDSGVLARWGGDEFVLISPGMSDTHRLIMAKSLRHLFHEPIDTSMGNQIIGCSIGIASSDENTTIAKVLHTADAQMYADKQRRHADFIQNTEKVGGNVHYAFKGR